MNERTRGSVLDYLSQHYGALRRKLTGMLGNSDLASDALQDTWLRLHSRGEHADNPQAYLLRTAINIAIDIQRRQSRLLSWDEIQELQNMPCTAPHSDEHYAQRQDTLYILDRLERLPVRQRQIFLLAHWEGLPHKDIASSLGISVRTVAYELKRIHDTLYATLQRQDKDT